MNKNHVELQLSCNQSTGQRAVIAVDYVSQISEDVNQERIEKLCETLARKAEGECLLILTNTQNADKSPVSSRAIAADIMWVSRGYITEAKRIKEAAPALSEEVRTGLVTIPEALRQLAGNADDPQATRVKTVFPKLRKIARNTEKGPAFLDRLEALIAEFADA